MSEPEFTIGIEEEYLLVDRASRDLASDPPPEMLSECQALLEGQVSPEFLRAQIEVGTSVCRSVADARAELAHLRRTVAEVATRHGLAPIAAATHPFGQWHLQKTTDRARYALLARDIQGPARRLVICGMHVHVGLDDPELRIDLMGQVAYFLPHLLALSTSSPFWTGEDTGLNSYRIAVFDEMPRTGLPELFESWGEFQRQLDVLVRAGLIEDGTKLWWDIRPSLRFPTLELRIADVCTRLDDGIAIAAIYRCLLRMLWRLKRANQRWRRYSAMLINENRWRAQRYGIDEGLVDFGKGRIVPYADLLEELLHLVDEDAEALDCRAEVASARDILKRGTSAHRQRAAYHAALANGAGKDEALKAVVDMLIAETTQGL
ncbi:MAG: glutamate---cysteine ligase / carboxylate-amine ligase [Rhodospirillaceae bacterium]|jgi:carboxylate-amine ligase|nr:glutamate---cysteine ligase / carboxylate-amine ligase [Rhodospirillaceae bacterium]